MNQEKNLASVVAAFIAEVERSEEERKAGALPQGHVGPGAELLAWTSQLKSTLTVYREKNPDYEEGFDEGYSCGLEDSDAYGQGFEDGASAAFRGDIDPKTLRPWT